MKKILLLCGLVGLLSLSGFASPQQFLYWDGTNFGMSHVFDGSVSQRSLICAFIQTESLTGVSDWLHSIG
jgi:hypothetical protein